MDTDKLKKLADLKYPDAIEFPLLHDHKAVIGPITFSAIEQIEEKFGSMMQMKEKISGGEVKQSDLFSLVFLLLENQDEFNDDVKEFGKHVPVSAAEPMMQVVFHFMVESMPKGAPADEEKTEETASTDGEESSEEKK